MSGDKGRQTTVGRLPRKAAQGEPVETPRCKKGTQNRNNKNT